MNRFVRNCLTIASGLCAIGLVFVVLGGIFGGFRQAGSIAANGGLCFPVSASVIKDMPELNIDTNTAFGIAEEEPVMADFSNTEEMPAGYFENDNVCGMAEVTNISVEIGAYKLEIRPWEAETYKITGKNVPGLKCFEQNGTLYLKGDRDFFVLSGDHSVTLYVPKGAELDKIEVELGAGKGSIEDLTADEMEIQLGAGKLACNNLTANTLDFEVGAGKINFTDCKMQEVSGEVGAGKLRYEGTIEGDADISCAVGSADLSLKGKYADFDYNTEVAMGSLSIIKEDGSKADCDGISERRIDNDADWKMDLECAMGNLTVRFQ